MKKYIIINVIVWIFVNNIYSQNPYYDALLINNKYISKNGTSFSFKTDNQSVSGLCPILRNYLPEKYKNTQLTEAQVLSYFTNNPFWGNQVTNLINGGVSANDAKPIASRISSISNLDITNIADGMAKFIVARAKNELSAAFFERFKNDLDSIEQIQIIFPATYHALKAIDQEIYNYSAYLDLLRESFQKDLNFLLPDIGKLIEADCMDELFTKYPEIRTILSDAIYIEIEFSQGKHPGEIVHNYITMQADKDKLNKIEPYLYPSLQTLDLFSQSLRSKQPDQYWISPDSLNLLTKDPITFNIYLGLIYQQALLSNDKIVFNGTGFTEILKSFKDHTASYEAYLTGLISKGRNANYYFKAIKEKQASGNDKPNYQDYYSLYESTIDVMEWLTQIPLSEADKFDRAKLESYFSTARSIGNIYVDVYEKQYTSAIVEFSSIYTALIIPKVKIEIATTENDIKGSDKVKKKGLEKKMKSLNDIQISGSLLLKYGNFAATIAKAESSDDVQAAIEAVALPAGSFSIKQKTRESVFINAYMGYAWDIKDSLYMHGIYAPVGLSWNWRITCKNKQRGAFTIFVSFIDIGGLAAYRLTNETDTLKQVVRLQSIISPSAQLMYEFPKLPINLCVGWRMTPNLYYSGNSKFETMPSTHVFHVSLLVDIPLFTIKTW